MRKYLTDYLKYINGEISGAAGDTDWLKLKREHLVQIEFMQHERLIHLIVTCLFSVILVLVIGLFCITGQVGFFLFVLPVGALVCAYIRHYYFLENSVQQMYKIYLKLDELSENGSQTAESGAVHEEENL
jgi:hypothetical protein